MPVWTHYFAHFVVAVIATISFGITFQMPRRHYLACGLTGAVGWMVYIFGVELFALSPAIATLVATLPLTGCARFFAIRHKAPVTIFLLPGIFPLVPGAGIYYTAYYFAGRAGAFRQQRRRDLQGRAGPGAGHCAGVQSAAAGRA